LSLATLRWAFLKSDPLRRNPLAVICKVAGVGNTSLEDAELPPTPYKNGTNRECRTKSNPQESDARVIARSI
jgi:hypothetical protein